MNKSQHVDEKTVNIKANFEFGAVQKCAHLVDLNRIILQTECLIANIGFDAAENGPNTLYHYVFLRDGSENYILTLPYFKIEL